MVQQPLCMTSAIEIPHPALPPQVIAADCRSEDNIPLFFSLSIQITFLACEYPFLQPQLVSFVTYMMQSPPADFPTEMRSYFESGMATTAGDVTQPNYGHLSEERQRTPDLVSSQTHLDRFIARLLFAFGRPKNAVGSFTGLNDTLFIIGTGLEEHADSHNLPNVDVPAAAQQTIHAAELFFEACEKGCVTKTRSYFC